MKSLTLIAIFISLSIFAQDPAKNKVVPLSVVINESPASLTLNWRENTAPGSNYLIYRKSLDAASWDVAIGSTPIGTATFTDYNITKGKSYEYLVTKLDNTQVVSWGYISAGIKNELSFNRGALLLLIDNSIKDSLQPEIEQLKRDLYNDGWFVKTELILTTETVVDVKSKITQNYSALNDLKAIYILGHVPVPYSGDIYPDGHLNHKGAWPADVFYADIDGVWTDNIVNTTTGSDTRNYNVPNDGKYDQSIIPTTLELEVCRVDFHDMPAFAENEIQLLKKYLNKAHEFKIGNYQPQERGMYDNNFINFEEGFAQNAIRNFAPFFGTGIIDEVDFFTTLSQDSYLWAYGCGGGSNQSANGLDNGTSLTTSELAGTELNAVFTMVFGSYFGDWDKTNNFMRAILANGKSLSISWAGRPNFHYHTMAKGDNLGHAAKLSMDKNSPYTTQNGGRHIHVAQLGDPSLRAYYIKPPTDLTLTNNSYVVELSWTASVDQNVIGYNVYRRTTNSIWKKLTPTIINTVSFDDNTIQTTDVYEYMVKSVELITNGSGSFYNESLGISSEKSFIVGLNEFNTVKKNFYPNPTTGVIHIEGISDFSYKIYSLYGQLIETKIQNSGSIDLTKQKQGLYLVRIYDKRGKEISEIKVLKN